MSEKTDRERRIDAVRRTVTKGVISAKDVASDNARSARDATVQGAKTVADSRTAQGLASAGDSVARRAKDVAAQGSELAGTAVSRGSVRARSAVGSARERIPWETVLPDDARSNLLTALKSTRTLSSGARRRMTEQMTPALSALVSKDISSQTQILSILHGWLASPDASRMLNGWLQDMVKGSPTIYDKAMDANFISTGIGGGDHRLFDGGHSIVGAFQAARNASLDDSIFEEASGLLQALARDATTPRGLPLVTWDQETFNGLADNLGRVGIPRGWLRDMVSYDAVELIGASLGVLAIALNWNSEDVEQFSQIVGSMGLAAVAGANPLLLIVTVVALGKAFHTARKTGDYKEFTDGLARGGICTGAVLLVTGMMGGSAVVVLLTGICVGIVAQQALQNVSFVEIGQWVIVQIKDASAQPVDAVTVANPARRAAP